MNKQIPVSSLLLSIFLLLSILGSVRHSQSRGWEPEARIVVTQYREEGERKGTRDTVKIDLLKKMKEVVDGWLKSINEEIEREDVTRFKVRFLEILRSLLEWIKEKLESWIETSEEDLREKSESIQKIRRDRSLCTVSG